LTLSFNLQARSQEELKTEGKKFLSGLCRYVTNVAIHVLDMAKGLRSKSRRKNIALKAQRLQKAENARFERIAQSLQEATGVGADAMGP
jgi:hypothetical protein